MTALVQLAAPPVRAGKIPADSCMNLDPGVTA